MISSSTADWAPIAVFAYNRPERLRTLISSLKACEGFPKSPVTVFVDGPKPGHEAAVDAVQRYIVRLDLPNVTYSFQPTNRGLRQSIFSGVSDVVSRYGRAIVVEDDLVLSPAALKYFNEALEVYADAQRVWSIAGYTYDAPALRGASRALALPFTHPWGWATWARAWKKFDLNDHPEPSVLKSRSFKTAFDMDGLYPFTSQLKNSIDGRVDSWFIHWYYTVFKHGGVSIFPPRRLVDNYGLRDGSHGSSLNPHDALVKRPNLLREVPRFCDPNVVDFGALDQLRQSRELRVQRLIAAAGSAKRMVRERYGRRGH